LYLDFGVTRIRDRVVSGVAFERYQSQISNSAFHANSAIPRSFPNRSIQVDRASTNGDRKSDHRH